MIRWIINAAAALLALAGLGALAVASYWGMKGGPPEWGDGSAAAITALGGVILLCAAVLMLMLRRLQAEKLPQEVDE